MLGWPGSSGRLKIILPQIVMINDRHNVADEFLN